VRIGKLNIFFTQDQKTAAMITAIMAGNVYVARKPRRKQPVISSEQGVDEQKYLDVAQCSVDDIRENCGANMGVWQGGDLR
jgi:hypothetical protein